MGTKISPRSEKSSPFMDFMASSFGFSGTENPDCNKDSLVQKAKSLMEDRAILIKPQSCGEKSGDLGDGFKYFSIFTPGAPTWGNDPL